jgi:hypothetical protein
MALCKCSDLGKPEWNFAMQPAGKSRLLNVIGILKNTVIKQLFRDVSLSGHVYIDHSLEVNVQLK